jgi:hypothetical protein
VIRSKRVTGIASFMHTPMHFVHQLAISHLPAAILQHLLELQVGYGKQERTQQKCCPIIKRRTLHTFLHTSLQVQWVYNVGGFALA